jgi:hypothetical protein
MNLHIVDYSEKAIALFGYTKRYTVELRALRGSFCRNAKVNPYSSGTWIFPKTRRAEVESWLNEKYIDHLSLTPCKTFCPTDCIPCSRKLSEKIKTFLVLAIGIPLSFAVIFSHLVS